jgi:catechol 2,3-dioxygenase-like lactoylglutathione lyase family enzyme
MRPVRVERIDHAVFRVADLERSIAFYRDVLGLAVVRRRDDLGLVHLRAGVSMVDLVDLNGSLGRKGGRGPQADGRNVDHLCLRVQPFDEPAIVAFLVQHQVRPRGAAARNFGAEGEGFSLYVQDPDGNTIELKGPALP